MVSFMTGNDLISRSALIKAFQKEKEFLQNGLGRDAEYAYMSADCVMCAVKAQPVVYDLAKVVGQLEEELRLCEDYHTNTGSCGNQIYAYKRALEIVKGDDRNAGD